MENNKTDFITTEYDPSKDESDDIYSWSPINMFRINHGKDETIVVKDIKLQQQWVDTYSRYHKWVDVRVKYTNYKDKYDLTKD